MHAVLPQVGLPQLEHRRLIFKRFVTIAARELAHLWGHPTAANPADPAGLERLGAVLDPALLAEQPCAMRPLPPAQLQRISAALQAVLPPSVRPPRTARRTGDADVFDGRAVSGTRVLVQLAASAGLWRGVGPV